MKKVFLFVVVLALALTACGVTPNSDTPSEVQPTTTETAEVPTEQTGDTTVVTNPTATYEPSVAGGDFMPDMETIDDGWFRVRQATNLDYCAWSNVFKLHMKGNIQGQMPHCVEWRWTGTGTITFTVKPDKTGYATSDTLGTGLAWWPSGNNGFYTVTRGSSITENIPLTTGPEGIYFPLNGDEVTITISLKDGFITMPLGEIRNNILPKY